MIRWLLGFFIVLGAVGGLETNSMGFSETIGWSLVGFALMIWATPKLSEQYGEEV